MSAIYIFIDDYACTAKLPDSAGDKFLDGVMISSQILLDSEREFAITFPLCDASDCSLDGRSPLGFEGFERWGLKEVLDSRGIEFIAKYLAVLIQECMRRIVRTTVVDEMVLSIPTFASEQEEMVKLAIKLISPVLAVKRVSFVESHYAATVCFYLEDQAANNDPRVELYNRFNYSAVCCLWRNGVTSTFWVKQATRQFGRFNETSFIEKVSANKGIQHHFGISDDVNEVSGLACSPAEQQGAESGPMVMTYSKISLGTYQSEFDNPFDEICNNDHGANQNGQSIAELAMIGAITLQENFAHYGKEQLVSSMRIGNNSAQLCDPRSSAVEKVFAGMQALATELPFENGTLSVSLVDSSGTDQNLSQAIELSSMKKTSQCPNLTFTLIREQNEVKLEVPLDPFDVDDKYLLEFDSNGDGSFRVLMRVGTRPVALKKISSDEAVLQPVEGRAYELTFSEEHREDVALRKSISNLVTSGVHFYGSEVGKSGES